MEKSAKKLNQDTEKQEIGKKGYEKQSINTEVQHLT